MRRPTRIAPQSAANLTRHVRGYAVGVDNKLTTPMSQGTNSRTAGNNHGFSVIQFSPCYEHG